MNRKNKHLNENSVGAVAGLSGFASILGSWQVCHSVCMWIIAALSIIGITVVGMPLFFLTTIAVPVWIFALALFAVTLFFYFSKGCISRNLIIFNAGVIVAGIPFQAVQRFQLYFWIVGGAIVSMSIFLYLKDKLR